VEDLSGKRALEILMPKLIASEHTYTIHSYKGIGRIPKSMTDTRDASKRILLENLPKLLKGYGRTFAGYSPTYKAAVIVVCDLDDNDRRKFLADLNAILNACNPKPQAHFCLAIEEGEAWFLGDRAAVTAAYPNAKSDVLDSYVNDSICGTWERLADALYPGGAKRLTQRGSQAVGAEKFKWAENISPGMKVEENASPSFQFFRETVRVLGSDGY
jgi:hypothetical protein